MQNNKILANHRIWGHIKCQKGTQNTSGVPEGHMYFFLQAYPWKVLVKLKALRGHGPQSSPTVNKQYFFSLGQVWTG